MKTCSRLAAAGLALLLPQAALADQSVETTLRQMVANLDATPEWAASFSNLSYDPVTDTATLSGFTARTERPGTEISVETIAVTGFEAQPDGTMKARSITADGGTVKSGFISAAIGDVGVDNLTVPVMEGFVFDPAKPFTSLARMYGEALKASFTRARTGSIVVTELIKGVENHVTYEHIRLDGFANGKLDQFRAGPVRMESPSKNGLIKTTIGSFESHDTDFAAFARVYDPDAYQGGVGDMVWHDGMRLAAYNDIVVDVPGAKITINSVAVEDLKVRQPPTSFADFLDAVMVNTDMPKGQMDRLTTAHVADMLGAWSVGRIGVSGFGLKAVGIDHFSLGGVTVSDFSIDGLGEFAIEDLGAAIRGQGAMRIGRFAFGKIAFGGIDGLNRLIAVVESGQDVDPASVTPALGFLELAGLEVQTPDIDHLGLARFRIDSTRFSGAVPTASTAELVGLTIPTSAIQDRKTREMLQRFGYDLIDFNAFVQSEWQEAGETLIVKDLRLGVKGMGSLVMKFALSGIPLAAFQDQNALAAALPGIKLNDGALTFKDETIVGTGLTLMAEQFGFNVPLEQFRKQFAGAVPLLLSFGTASDPKLGALIQKSGLLSQLTPAVSKMVAAPGGSITLTVKPPAPVTLETIPNIAETAPQNLAALLGLSISGEEGVAPPPPAPAPAAPSPTPAPPPAPAPGAPEGGGAHSGTGGGQQPAN
jgi:hypothetical protein